MDSTLTLQMQLTHFLDSSSEQDCLNNPIVANLALKVGALWGEG